MPIEIKCAGCGEVLVDEKRIIIQAILTKLVGSRCPKCKRKLESPDLKKLEILPME